MFREAPEDEVDEVKRAERSRILSGMIAAAAEAGTKIRHMAAHGIVVRSKSDASPVTDADEAAEAIIEQHLSELLPGVPVIGEEAVAGGSSRKPGTTFFLVDPIDGTRDFIAKREGYTVNIALIHEGTPILGVIYAPAIGELYAGGADGASRWPLVPGINIENVPEERIRVRTPGKSLVACVSHAHLDRDTQSWLKQRGISETIKIGSSIKFCRLAEGKADIYPRLSPVSEWDVAAGHAILMAAGGSVRAPDNSPLHYGKRDDDYEVTSFVAAGVAPR